MKKLSIIILLLVGFIFQPKAYAQLEIAGVIQAGVKKVIKAIDLKVQRLQNKTIWLQNAQKTLENTLSKLKLREIADWSQRQKALYGDYFQELRKVKTSIAYYHRIKDLTSQQSRLLEAYQQTWSFLSKSPCFRPDELDHMAKVYSGNLKESLRHIERILLVAGSFSVQMEDAQRLTLLREAAREAERNYHDLLRFNAQNRLLHLQRKAALKEIQFMKVQSGGQP